jgi:hypothetical protein
MADTDGWNHHVLHIYDECVSGWYIDWAGRGLSGPFASKEDAERFVARAREESGQPVQGSGTQ